MNLDDLIGAIAKMDHAKFWDLIPAPKENEMTDEQRTDCKPCPFCGYNDDLRIEGMLREHADNDVWVVCWSCGTEGPPAVDGDFTKGSAEAWALWNKRTITTPDELANAIAIQRQDGNWNHSPYMHGLLNGLLFAEAVFTGGAYEPVSAPDKWTGS